MGAGLRDTTIPRHAPSAGATTASLASTEAFVLSQVDGASSVEELASIVALSVERTCEVLVRLREIGLVTWEETSPSIARDRRDRPVIMRSLRREEADDSPHSAPEIAALSGAIVLRLVPSRDVTRLGIDVNDGFLLGQLDGVMSLDEIASVTGRSAGELSRRALRLIEVGAIEEVRVVRIPSRAPPPPTPPNPPATSRDKLPPTPQSPTGRSKGRMPRQSASSSRIAKASAIEDARAGNETLIKSKHKSAPPPARAPSVERAAVVKRTAIEDGVACDLSDELQSRVRSLVDSIFDLSHYDLLGIHPTADAARVQQAFDELALTLDPAAHPHERLGPLLEPMTTLFGRLSVAREALTSTTRRLEYDRYLQLRARAKLYEDSITSPPVPSVQPPTSETRLEGAASYEGVASSSKLRVGPVTDASRKNALALQMLAERARNQTASVPPLPPTAPVMVTTTLPGPGPSPTETMRKRVEEMRALSQRAQVQKHLDAAASASTEDDPGLAARHYKMALAITESAEIRALFEAAAEKVHESAIAGYLEQARYEEESDSWQEAVGSYERAYKQRPEPRFAERIANAIVRAGLPVDRAVKLAEEAAQKLPDAAWVQLTLGAAYIRDGQLRRGRIALERAVKLDPTDGRAAEMLKRL